MAIGEDSESAGVTCDRVSHQSYHEWAKEVDRPGCLRVST
jgi:hypothetical protein